jgi:hypothetical protein
MKWIKRTGILMLLLLADYSARQLVPESDEPTDVFYPITG